jgi:hypothetical protein
MLEVSGSPPPRIVVCTSTDTSKRRTSGLCLVAPLLATADSAPIAWPNVSESRAPAIEAFSATGKETLRRLVVRYLRVTDTTDNSRRSCAKHMAATARRGRPLAPGSYLTGWAAPLTRAGDGLLGRGAVAWGDVHLLSRRLRRPSRSAAVRPMLLLPRPAARSGSTSWRAVLPGCMNAFCRPYGGNPSRLLRFGLPGLLLGSLPVVEAGHECSKGLASRCCPGRPGSGGSSGGALASRRSAG